MNSINGYELEIEDKETVKVIVENTNAILIELNRFLWMIEESIYGVSNDDTARLKEQQDLPLLVELKQQRDYINSILARAVHIKEGLW